MKVSVLVVAVVLFTVFELGLCRELGVIKMKGMDDTDNSAEIENLARFAVEEHNRMENGLLEFARVLKAQEQVVAGKLYHLTLEAADASKNKMIFKAKIWVKPWMNFKQLLEFKRASDVSPLPFSVSDLGIMGDETREQEMATHDPEVRTAANHAVKSIQMRSNSLLPYELLEILHAKAEIVEDFVKYNLLLKLKRGVKMEMFKVDVHKTFAGKYLLKRMEPYNP